MNLSSIKFGNLDPVNLKSSVFTFPGGIPLSLSIVESVNRVRVHVAPRLAANTVGEVCIGSADSHVENEVEFSIEGGSVVLTNPGVVEAGRELASIEEALGSEVNLEDLIGLVINVGIDTSLIPEEAVDVEIFSKRFGILVVSMSSLELILIPIGAPMKGGTEFVTATTWIGRTVAARFHKIDFSRCRPVSELVVLWKQPYCGPYPVTLRKLSSNFEASILEGK